MRLKVLIIKSLIFYQKSTWPVQGCDNLETLGNKSIVHICWLIRRGSDFMILVEGFTHVDWHYTTKNRAILFLVLLFLFHASCLLVDLILLKEYLILQYSLTSALLFRLLACSTIHRAQMGLSQPLCLYMEQDVFCKECGGSALSSWWVGVRDSVAQWKSPCTEICTLYTDIQKIFKG